MAKVTKVSSDCYVVEGDFDRVNVLLSLDEVLGPVYSVVALDGEELWWAAEASDAIFWAACFVDKVDEEAEFDEIGDGMSDVEADADTLRMAGFGTDEDYGYYGDDY